VIRLVGHSWRKCVKSGGARSWWINWTGFGGVLVQAATVLGPRTTNSATSPYTVPVTGNAEFYRIKLP